MKTADDMNLRRSLLQRFLRPPPHLFKRISIGVGLGSGAGESAERTAVDADVRVIYVPVDVEQHLGTILLPIQGRCKLPHIKQLTRLIQVQRLGGGNALPGQCFFPDFLKRHQVSLSSRQRRKRSFSICSRSSIFPTTKATRSSTRWG